MSAPVWAVVPAAGKGTRMGAELPKQYLPLAGRTVIEHTLATLAGHPRIAGVMVALAADDAQWRSLAPAMPPSVRTTVGGAERCHSVQNALDALPAAADDWVLVHDAARPCLRRADVDRLLDALVASEWGGILAVPVRDTLKRCAADGRIETTVDRNRLWQALTPQMFRLGALRQALAAALAGGRLVTDEAQAIELIGGAPRVVEGRADNIKITRPEDLATAELYLRARAEEETPCA